MSPNKCWWKEDLQGNGPDVNKYLDQQVSP